MINQGPSIRTMFGLFSRRRVRRASGLIFAFSLLLFVVCLLYISLSPAPTITDLQIKQILNGQRPAAQQSGPIVPLEQRQHLAPSLRELFLRNASWTVPQPPMPQSAAHEQGEHKFEGSALATVMGDPEKAVESVQFLNAHHEVLNEQMFGKLSANNVDYVIIVQVHERLDYLKYLVGSLSRAVGIHRVLLVFSHDLNSHPINQMLKSINFCRVIQLFFPYNIQLFPNNFPGRSPVDCPEGIDREKAKELKCADAQFPDVGGHYRVPKLAQIKHHWWWKLNYVLDGVLPKYGLSDKLMVLLEEDHIVTPDLLHTLRLMEHKRAKVCPDCELLSLGSYPKSFANYAADIAKLAVELWYSSKYNMGMVLDGRLWDRVRNCSKFFCEYDDYNWDWTLLQLSVKCLPTKMRVIYAKAPRVVHIGDCGVHTHRCTADKAVHEALQLFQSVNSSFFPPALDVVEVNKRMLRPSKPNGGWADPRDRRLCTANTRPFAKQAEEGTKAADLLANARAALEEGEEAERQKKRMGRREAGGGSPL